MGWGLRVREDVPKGSLLIEYVGEIISEDQMRVIIFFLFSFNFALTYYYSF